MARRQPTGAPVKATSLAVDLAALDDAALAALMAARPDLANPPPPHFEALAERASGWPSVFACFRGLDRWSQQVVEGLCLLSRPTTVARLVDLMGHDLTVEQMEPALAILARLALLRRRGDQVELAAAFAQLSYPAGLGPPVDVVLASHTASELQAIARHIGLVANTTKAQTLVAVATALADPACVAKLLRTGPSGTAELAHQVWHQGPMATIRNGMYGALHDRTPIGWMVNRGLMATVSWTAAVMPREVGLALGGGRPFPHLAIQAPTLAATAVDPETVDRGGAEAGLRLVSDLIAVLDDWAEAPAKLLKAGGLGMREVRRVVKTTGRSEADSAWMIDLAAVSGLIDVEYETDTVLPTPDYDRWLGLEPAARWSRLVESWLVAPLHLSLAGAIGTNEKPIPSLLDRGHEAPSVPRRRMVLDALAIGDAGSSVSGEAMAARMAWQAPALWEGGPASAPTMVRWVIGEAEALGVVAHGAITTAGRMSLVGDQAGARAAIAARAPAVSAAFVLQADLTAVSAGELPATVRAELELMADVESKGSVSVYRFSESSLRRGFDAGRNAEAILGFLGDHATRGVPQALSYLVDDLGRRFGRLRAGAARCYLRSDDTALLAEVLRARRTARLGLRQLAPTVLVCDAEPVVAIAALHGAGYLPAHEDANGDLILARPGRRRTAGGRWSRWARSVSEAAGGHEAAALAGRRPGILSPPEAVARLRKAPQPRVPTPAVALAPTRKPLAGRLLAAESAAAAAKAAAAAAAAAAKAASAARLFELDVRPADIAQDRGAIGDLFRRAFAQDWILRVAYSGKGGKTTQLNVAVLDVSDTDVLVECLPRCDTRQMILHRVRWARVLTEAEEELLAL